MKKNKYIILTVICVLLALFAQYILASSSLPKEECKFSVPRENLTINPFNPVILILGIFYLAIFLTGIINLFIFCIRKIQSKPLTEIQEIPKKLSLSGETISKLLFLISFIMLTAYLLSLMLIVLGGKSISLNFSLILNMALQIGTIIIILKYIKAKFFGFYINGGQFTFLLRVYTALLPVIFVSLLWNTFFLEKLGLQYSSGPMLEILFIIKSKFSIFILATQIIFLGPIAEELFFRGFMYKLLRNKYAFTTSAIITSSFFSIIHRTPQNILPLFVISLGLCYVYEKTQNIMPAIIFHAIHNAIGLLFFLTMKSLT